MSNTLKHYGVLGMKWGVRRRRNGPAIYTRKADRLARKIARQRVKASKYKYKSLKTGNLDKHNKLQAKAYKIDFKAAKNDRKILLTKQAISKELLRREQIKDGSKESKPTPIFKDKKKSKQKKSK